MKDLDQIYNLCCEAFGVDIKMKTRVMVFPQGRCAFYYYAKKYTKRPHWEISHYVRVHHSTMCAGLNKLAIYKEHYNEFKEPFKTVGDQLEAAYKNLSIEELKDISYIHTKYRQLKDKYKKVQQRNWQLTRRIKLLQQ